ncbi:unnamed protein product [Cladocopium goreaui]|uniref:Uncharacterized protein n=1 Tax=Cladocopium goreaui TaxID=2562237 RepID=A0A9P1GPI3_9DINO|nr:unnamed protein product [Cladocopium goreaui]
MVATCSGTKTAPLQECRLRCLACLNARLEHIASYQKVIKQNVLLIIAMHWFLPPRLNGTLEQWRRVFLLQRKRQCGAMPFAPSYFNGNDNVEHCRVELDRLPSFTSIVILENEVQIFKLQAVTSATTLFTAVFELAVLLGRFSWSSTSRQNLFSLLLRCFLWRSSRSSFNFGQATRRAQRPMEAEVRKRIALAKFRFLWSDLHLVMACRAKRDIFRILPSSTALLMCSNRCFQVLESGCTFWLQLEVPGKVTWPFRLSADRGMSAGSRFTTKELGPLCQSPACGQGILWRARYWHHRFEVKSLELPTETNGWCE